MKLINEYITSYLKNPNATEVEMFRQQTIRHGIEHGSPLRKRFHYQLARLRNQRRSNRKALLNATGLSHPHIGALPKVYLPQLRNAYPPIGHWIVENKDIYSQWNEYLQGYKLSDMRHRRYPTHLLQVKNLRLDIGPEESAIIYDKNTEDIIGVVIRKFSNSPEVLEWATSILKRSTEVATSVRVCFIYL